MTELPAGIELMIDAESVRVIGDKQALVASKSHDGDWHTVELVTDEQGTRWECTCRGFEIRKSCRHAVAIRRWMNGEAEVKFREDPTE